MANKIEYNEVIPNEEFAEFLDVLSQVDPTEYEAESKDNFVDLYNYWTNLGHRRFTLKLIKNKEKIKK